MTSNFRAPKWSTAIDVAGKTIMCASVAALLYLSSCPPILAFAHGVDRLKWIDGDERYFYAFDYAMDETALRRPLMWWAQLWGEREDLELRAFARRLDRYLEAHPRASIEESTMAVGTDFGERRYKDPLDYSRAGRRAEEGAATFGDDSE